MNNRLHEVARGGGSRIPCDIESQASNQLEQPLLEKRGGAINAATQSDEGR